jgi:hypothetical protein
MNAIWNHAKENLINCFHNFGWAWWVEIVTQNPRCTYYFGPFLSSKEAEAAKNGYIEDLDREGAQGIAVKIKRCKPSRLTIGDDLGERAEPQIKPILSNQM